MNFKCSFTVLHFTVLSQVTLPAQWEAVSVTHTGSGRQTTQVQNTVSDPRSDPAILDSSLRLSVRQSPHLRKSAHPSGMPSGLGERVRTQQAAQCLACGTPGDGSVLVVIGINAFIFIIKNLFIVEVCEAQQCRGHIEGAQGNSPSHHPFLLSWTNCNAGG